jgi:hypothetical protein
MKKKRIGLFTIASVLLIIIVLQFFRGKNTNPESNPEMDFMTIMKPPEEIASLIRTSCYDCHSNETRYPWYSKVAPFSWTVHSHVSKGREHLNFSEWGTYPPGKRGDKLDGCKELVKGGYMPLKSYKRLHPEARLNEDQTKILVKWLTVE